MRVALVTVGDELLAGDTVNTNAAWLGQRLAERGVDVERITVVPDRESDIARVVNEYHAEYDAVIVTGGLGPTHDDITMDAVAHAFGRDLVEHEEVYDWLEETRGYKRENLAERTAYMPDGAHLLKNPEGVAPGCIIGDVYVLPGVPTEMKAMFETIADDFVGEARFVETVVADEPESHLIDRISDLQERFDVTVGSYPGETVRVKIEGRDESTVTEAADWLRQRVDPP
ncbi:molybdopterin-binding protein [Haloarculaceae archaeon H-GB11]|nr:molybdopterin-binding protein [Haloarculaceae archaeon H-GB11]